MALRLAKLGIHTAQDILFHLPLRYEDRSRITPIRQLQIGQTALVEAEIVLTEVIRRHRLSMICQIADASGRLRLRFFHFSNAQRQHLVTGQRIRCFGEVRLGANGLEMIHPEYQLLEGQTPPPLSKTLTPVYPTTEGIAQALWRQLTEQVLN